MTITIDTFKKTPLGSPSISKPMIPIHTHHLYKEPKPSSQGAKFFKRGKRKKVYSLGDAPRLKYVKKDEKGVLS